MGILIYRIAHSQEQYHLLILYMAKLVPTYDIRLVFEKVRPLLQKAIDKGNQELDAQDVYLRLLNGRFQLWITSGLKGVCITEIIDYPKRRTIRIVLLSGEDFKEWGEDGDKSLMDWGRKIGATHIDCLGRKGWAKVLKEYNFAEGYTHMIKEIP